MPSDGGTHGDCTRKLSLGAAWYTHVASASDGDSTRCYPAQVWRPNWFNGVVARGRFYVNVTPSEVGNDEFLSLVTLSLHPDGLVTLNLKVDSTGPTAGKLRLLLWHVPSFGQGDQARPAYVVFPTRQWVEVVMTLSPSGAVEVRQDGRLVLTAQKKDAPGEVEAAHFGGYASAAVSGWTIGNDDLRVQSYGTSLPPIDGAPPAPAPAPSLPATPAKRGAILGTAGADRLVGGKLPDRVLGGQGRDTIFGLQGRDTLLGGIGRDRLFGGAGADRLYGGKGDDLMYGGPGSDLLVGGPGRDALVSGPGADTLDAVDGEEDSVRCGPGRDRVTADRIDRVDIQCESVVRATFLGTRR